MSDREKQIEEASKTYKNLAHQGDLIRAFFKMGAQWADENPEMGKSVSSADIIEAEYRGFREAITLITGFK